MKFWLKQIITLIWDVDGTLYRVPSDVSHEVTQCTYKAVSKQTGLSFKDVQKQFEKRYQKFNSHTQVVDSFGIDGKAVINSCFQNAMVKLVNKDKQLIEMFEKLKNYQHIILTNGGKKATLKKLERLGLHPDIFDAIYTAYEMPVIKPDPQVYKQIIDEQQLDVAQSLAIGDRVHTDLLPAKKLGMRTCLVWGESEEVDVCMNSVYKIGTLFEDVLLSRQLAK